MAGHHCGMQSAVNLFRPNSRTLYHFLASGKVNPDAKDKDGLSPLSKAESRMSEMAKVNPSDSQLMTWTNITETMRLYAETAKANDAEVFAHLVAFIVNTDKTPGFRDRLPSRR